MFTYPKKYEVIVVGGGHAGLEAALAASRMGCSTLLLTMNINNIALMSCNPAIGGLAKGQLVKEIDALGGEMGKAIDRTGIQFRILNTHKGPAVRSSRAQADRGKYRLYMREILENQSNLDLKQGTVEKIIVKDEEVLGVQINLKGIFIGKTVIVCSGTFLNGLMHIGFTSFPGGRIGDFSSLKLSQSLRALGFRGGRFETTTCPRLDGRSINFSKLMPQHGDSPPSPFSFSTKKIIQKQADCYITWTNLQTHEIIRHNLDRSPLHTGVMKGANVRYCPSIEDKVIRFPDRNRHQIFLEPEGLGTYEFYPNGLFTALPLDVQIELLHSIEGLEKVEVMRPGYGIEYDYIDPTQLSFTLETKIIKSLYFAGQINGTTGYEEAAAQGLVAGINAALKVKGKTSLKLDRSQAYVGVLIDDLVTRGTNEPYRMFTSRAEYRLTLREDNADLRLRELGHKIGLVKESECKKVKGKKKRVKEEILRLKKLRITPQKFINKKFQEWRTDPLKRNISLEELLRRPQITYKKLKLISKEVRDFSPQEEFQIEVQVKYRGYIEREKREVQKFKKMEKIKIPSDFDFSKISGLSTEVKEKLLKFQPLSLGQASRISGITPAAVSLLMIYIVQRKRNSKGKHG